MRTGVFVSDRHIHHLDHLLPLAAILEIPAYVTDPDLFEMGKSCYPDVDLHHVSYSDFSPYFLAQEFDALITSSKLWRHELGGMLDLFAKKQLRFIYCPHGNSDKGNCNERFEPYRCQEYALIYGQQMADRNKEWGVKLNVETRVGNYRHAYYEKHRTFYDNLISNHLQIPKDKRIVLYAPTWNDSSLFEIEKEALKKIPEEFFLIVKLHPYLKETHLSDYIKIQSVCERSEQMVFFDALPPIYPILERCDAYIGDMSSIGYDFLYYNRPMFFFGDEDTKKPLFTCGHQLKTFNWEEIADHFEQDSQKKMRRELYHYVFDEISSLKVLKEKVCNELLTLALH